MAKKIMCFKVETVYRFIGILLVGLCAIVWYRLSLIFFEYIALKFPVSFINDGIIIEDLIGILVDVQLGVCLLVLFLISVNFLLGILAKIIGLYNDIVK